MKKKDLAIILTVCSALTFNATLASPAFAKGTIERTNNIEANYNPFADDEAVVDDHNLSMSEKISLIQKEQTQSTKIENVQDGHVYIPKKTQLKVELVNPITSKTAQTGEDVSIKLVDNLIVNNVVVIPKDTIGKAYVYKARSAGGFGRKGVLMIAGDEFKTINNITVPLKQGINGEGKSDGGAVAVAAAISLIGGAFMKGTNIDYPAGTAFTVEVRENVDLQATPDNLQNVMDPNKIHGTEIIVPVQ